MYRLVDVDMTDKVFQKISKAISANLCEMMEMTFGELDEDGIFSDEERINKFMYGNEYLCILCGEKIIFNSGVTMNWWQVVGSKSHFVCLMVSSNY